MTHFTYFRHIGSFCKKSKTVTFNHFLIRVIKCNFRKTKQTDLKESLNRWISAKKPDLLHYGHEFSVSIQNFLLSAFQWLLSEEPHEKIKRLRSVDTQK